MDLAVVGSDYERLAEAAGHDPATLYAVFLTALNVLLARWSRQTLVTVGVPPLRPAGPLADAATTVPNALPIVTEVRAESSFRELLARVRASLDEAYGHQDHPLPILLEELGWAGEAGACPLFDVDCRFTAIHGELPRLEVAMRITLTDRAPGLVGVIEFDPELLGDAEARWFRDHLAHAVASASADLDQPVHAVGALPAEAFRKVVVDWNRTELAGWAERCLHRRFEALAADRGDAAALELESARLGYAQLNARANQLARFLVRDLGVRLGDVVGVAAARSFELVIALLGILKAGAAYVPLDPLHPPARLGFMLQDTNAKALLTLGHVADRLPAFEGPVIRLDELFDRIDRHRADNLATGNLEVPALPDLPACIIYTSGTTGQPKGVMLTHRGISNSLCWEEAAYQLSPDDRLLHLASVSFSLAILEIFAPLCVGARVVLAPAGATRDSGWIARLVAEHGITILSVVPAELNLLLEQEPSMPWTRLRRVITGADVLPLQVQQRYLATCPSVPLFNLYGQTETSVDGTYWICRPMTGQSNVPIGRPIANSRVYVFDADMRPVPIGAPGELYLGGEGVASGYVGRPGRTAERFVPDPFGQGGRLYRSGDIARWLPDGVLELLGRDDHQVQVHGVRVDLEEIEAVLRDHPDVRDAVVTARQRRPAGPPSALDLDRWETLLARVDGETAARLLAEAEAAEAADG